MAAVGLLPLGPSASPCAVRMHPTVLFTICDSFIRRNDNSNRVIGSLLGVVLADGTVEVRNAYAVPHNESSDQVGANRVPVFSTQSYGWTISIAMRCALHGIFRHLKSAVLLWF